MNEQELKEIEARAEAATPGPWKGDRNDGTIKYLMLGGKDGQAEVLRVDHKNGHYGFFMSDDIPYLESQANEEFVKHARQDVPALCAEVRRLNEENNRLRADMQSALRGLNEWGEYMCAKILANSLKGGAS